jgi:hypothetical protein
LTTAPRIKPTSIFLRSARRPNPGRRLHLSTRKFCSDNRDQLTIFDVCTAHVQLGMRDRSLWRGAPLPSPSKSAKSIDVGHQRTLIARVAVSRVTASSLAAIAIPKPPSERASRPYPELPGRPPNFVDRKPAYSAQSSASEWSLPPPSAARSAGSGFCRAPSPALSCGASTPFRLEGCRFHGGPIMLDSITRCNRKMSVDRQSS